MAGIYLHIPFCKQACHYCNFHFSTSLKYKQELMEAMLEELQLQKDYLKGETIETIYFGGGTPSLLSSAELNILLEKIQKLHVIQPDAEITLEANPDDLTLSKIKDLRQTAINRFSIGIQSFFDEDLVYMNRVHSANEAEDSIKLAQDLGFTNLTIDLIYGAPTTSDDRWLQNIQKAIGLDIPHLSSYALTVEPKTALAHFVETGKAAPLDEAQAARQFQLLMQCLQENGFEHYEISNFAKPGHYAQHNSNYWKGTPYLGVGPSAHSFNKASRQWNVANNAKYIKSIQRGELPFEQEILTLEQQYNEYVMTGLRTIWGCSLKKIETIHPKFLSYFQKKIIVFVDQDWVNQEEDQFTLTSSGKLLADRIAMELFWD